MMVPCTQDESDSDDDEYFSDEDSGPKQKRRKMVHILHVFQQVLATYTGILWRKKAKTAMEETKVSLCMCIYLYLFVIV